MLKVTFYCFSTILNKGFVNVEYHKSIDNARLRALSSQLDDSVYFEQI
jgi:hypothetical protein